MFDLSAHVAEEDYKEQAAVDAVHVCPSLMRALVRDYLLHQVWATGIGLSLGRVLMQGWMRMGGERMNCRFCMVYFYARSEYKENWKWYTSLNIGEV